MTTLNSLLQAIVERGAKLVEPVGRKEEPPAETLQDICRKLLSSKGEAAGVALAHRALNLYGTLTQEEKGRFFAFLASELDPDPKAVAEAAKKFVDAGDVASIRQLTAAAEPPRQELFRRLNFAPSGTLRLVRMREDLIKHTRENADLKRIDDDLRHLLSSWFNRGFLNLEPIDWDTSAKVLEKIIAYEAVHEISGWDDLRRRTEPEDRRCFAFFHPAMPEEPLVFVEVALTADIPVAIHDVLAEDRESVPQTEATTAVFYSISNCQAGLLGISFGAFLIKQVVHDLSRELPNLDTFVTLSPVPGFAKWMRGKVEAEPECEQAPLINELLKFDWIDNAERQQALAAPVKSLAAKYLVEEKRYDSRPLDPVARFHLGNGAALHQVNWMADLSDRGRGNAGSVMVNYLYEMDKLEENHEAFSNDGTIATSRVVSQMLTKKT